MRASAIILATAAGVAVSIGGGTPTQAMTAKPIGLLAATPALDLIEPVHCRRFRHAHPRGHGLSRGCDSVRGVRLPPRFGPTPAQTIQSGTRPVTSGESTRTEPLRRGPDSPTPSGVRPLSSERPSSGSSSSPFSSPSGGSPFSGSSGGLR
jgi:hypothetical protein